MSNLFIPSFHFDAPDTKLTPEWCMKNVNYHYYSQANFNLLRGKNVRQIDDFSSGDFDMTPYKRMFKSMQKKLQAAAKNPDGSLTEASNNIDTVGLEDWEQIALIVSVLNSAIENMMKLPMDITCEAQDSLAMKKRKEDIDFLKAKPEIEADLQPLADEMGVGKVDLGTTKNSSVKFSDAPMGLDLNDPEHEKVFTQLFYSLRVTTAFEKFLKQWGGVKKVDMLRRLEVTDHFKYGVASLRGYISSMTGLPDDEYLHPSRVFTPQSSLPDFSDNTHRIVDFQMTVMEMFNHFSNEICDEETLERMINGKGNDGYGAGYCGGGKNGTTYVDSKSFNTFRVNLKYIEVKSVDWVGVKKGDNNRGSSMFTDNEKECTSKIWGQNTYGFYWLVNTKHCFGIHRLDYSHRTRGQEAFQNFSTHLYRSQPKSAVELSIAENKMAQIAYIKLKHALIKSGPRGKYFDLRFMRSALSGLKNENNQWTQQDLINLFVEQNVMIGDTEGFDGKNDGQIKPFMEIPGGLRIEEVSGYWQTILNAKQNIAIITGINQQLTGQSPEELIGLQQLQINSGLNAINYCNIGIQNQFEALYNNWAYYLQSAIEAGGKTKEAVINYIGEEDTEILDALNEAPLHELTFEIKFGENYAMMQSYMQQFNFLKSQGIITTVDEYLLEAVDNPKEKFQKMYFIEQRWKKEQEKIRAEQYANAQALEQQRSQTALQVKQADGQQKTQQIYAKGDVESKILQLGGQLGMSSQQMDGIIKKQLQKERNDAQMAKAVKTIQEKENAKQQSALV